MHVSTLLTTTALLFTTLTIAGPTPAPAPWKMVTMNNNGPCRDATGYIYWCGSKIMYNYVKPKDKNVGFKVGLGKRAVEEREPAVVRHGRVDVLGRDVGVGEEEIPLEEILIPEE